MAKKTTMQKPQASLLTKIAEAFEQGLRPFEVENARLQSLATVGAINSGGPRLEIAENIWLDYEKGADVKFEFKGNGDSGFKIALKDRGQSRWFSLSYAISATSARETSHIGLYLDATSNGITSARPCIRYNLENDFKDRFFKRPVIIQSEQSENITFSRVDTELLNAAHSLEILFFFEGRSFEIDMHEVKNIFV